MGKHKRFDVSKLDRADVKRIRDALSKRFQHVNRKAGVLANLRLSTSHPATQEIEAELKGYTDELIAITALLNKLGG